KPEQKGCADPNAGAGRFHALSALLRGDEDGGAVRQPVGTARHDAFVAAQAARDLDPPGTLEADLDRGSSGRVPGTDRKDERLSAVEAHGGRRNRERAPAALEDDARLAVVARANPSLVIRQID